MALARSLLRVHGRRQARTWKRALRKWHSRHQAYLGERTVAVNQDPRKRQWRYTHARLRSAFRQLSTIQDDLLRSCYRPSPELPGTTNYLEGGINSQLRTLLKHHRGMPYEHQMKLVERYLYSRTEVAKLAGVLEQKPPRKIAGKPPRNVL